jgi:hypothetical protein
MAYPIGLVSQSAVIAAGTSLSAATPLGAGVLTGIVMPAVWTAAGLTFQVSADGGTTWYELQDGTGAAVGYTVSAGIAFNVDPYLWGGFNMLRVRSGTSGSPVNQVAAATILLQTIPLIT